MRPRSRQISTASRQGAADLAAAATMAQSTPRPSVMALICSWISPSPRTAASAPSPFASSTRSGFRSVAMTKLPWRRTNCATNWPTSPSPITATFSPSETLAIRTLLIAILPMVAKQACSNRTFSGIRTTRLRPTRTVSPCPVPSPP